MKSPINNNEKREATGFTDVLPLIRLALLIVPELMICKSLYRSPIVCGVAAGVVMGVWLTVDVWPFRVETPKLAQARIPRQNEPVARRKMNQAHCLNYLFCRMMVFALMFQSKLTI